MRSICSHCARFVVGRGLCKAHYRAFMKYGDPTARANLRGVPFHERYTIDERSGCWLWIGSTDTSGYGIGKVQGEVRAHRVSWTLVHGPIPIDMQVLHRCDTPACVNPEHLFLGTHQDNMADLRAKGRAYGAPGEANFGAKLTEAQATKIMADPRPASQIARGYRITPSAVDMIRNGRSWKHLFDAKVRETRLAQGPQRLSEEEKTAIAHDPRRQVDIAAEYGISQTRVSVIKRTSGVNYSK